MMNLKFIIVICLTIGTALSASFVEPETRVSISVFDLVNEPRKTALIAAPVLQRQYVEKVLHLVREQKNSLLKCLGEGAHASLSVRFQLTIAPSGEAQALPRDSQNSASACLEVILAEIHYPNHKLGAHVEIEFPLELERRNF